MRRSSQHRRGWLAALALAAGPLAAAQSSVVVQPPPGWFAGDTHVHLQQCPDLPDLTIEAVHDAMLARGLDLAAVQLWAKWADVQQYLDLYAAQVTGVEEPQTLDDPAHRIQRGVEVSGFAASQFGHLQALNVQTGFFPQDELYGGPILESFRAQPGAIAGYAHVLWFEDYEPRPFFGGVGGVYLAPIDAAIGAIDFVESARVAKAAGTSWRGLYYKLLNSGLRVALVGGSDNSCYSPEIGDTRTFARLGDEPLTFDAWCQAVRAGRTTIADGESRFVDLEVDGTGIGGEVDLAEPGSVQATATLSVAAGVAQSGTLRLLRNGVEVAAEPYDLPDGGTATLQAAVDMPSSGWLAAATADNHAHTAAIYVTVADRPIAQAQDAQYWVHYCDDLAANLGVFGVPTAEGAILERIQAARKVYSALASLDLPLPEGVLTYGPSTPSCLGPIAIGVTSPPGEPFAVDCIGAPPGASGLLVLGLAPDTEGTPIAGLTLLVKVGLPYFLIPVTATAGGYAQVPLSVPSGKHVCAQFVWLNPAGCGAGGLLAASNGLEVTVP